MQLCDALKTVGGGSSVWRENEGDLQCKSGARGVGEEPGGSVSVVVEEYGAARQRE